MPDPLPATPAAPAVVAPAPDPTPPPATREAEGHPITDNAFDEIDRIAAQPEKPRPIPPARKEASKEPAKEPETPKPDAVAKPDDNEPKTNSGLRKVYETTKKRVADLESELNTLKSKPADDPEKKALQDRLSEREKRLEDLETEMRFVSYQSSAEYKDKFQKPFESAYANGRNKAASLKVNTADGDPRQGTAEDFDAIMQITDDGTAAERAAELFGTQAPMILYHRERVMERNMERWQAIEDYKTKGAEREKQRAEVETKTRAEFQKQTGEIGQKFKDEAAAAVEKYPQFFKDIEGDDAGNTILKKGFEMADCAFAMNALDPKLTPDERGKVVRLHAAVRNKAAGFDRLAHVNSGLKAKVAELQAKLDEIAGTSPGDGEAKRVKAGDAFMTIDEEIDRMASTR